MKKTLATALLAGTLLGGGAVGAALFGPSVATAQSSSSDSSSSSSDAAPDAAPGVPDGPRGHGRGGPHGRADLGVAASTIGITEDELRTALQDGQSIADVATAHGVDPQTVIDALVADAQAKLAEKVASGEITQERADEIGANLAQRITDLVNHTGGPGGGPGCPKPGGEGPSGSDGSSSSSDTPQSEGSSLDT